VAAHATQRTPTAGIDVDQPARHGLVHVEAPERAVEVDPLVEVEVEQSACAGGTALASGRAQHAAPRVGRARLAGGARLGLEREAELVQQLQPTNQPTNITSTVGRSSVGGKDKNSTRVDQSERVSSSLL
jgi:hypothetical protein